MAKAMTALGLMSGTSMDGIDLALLETDGEGAGTRLGSGFLPYPDAVKDVIRRSLGCSSDPDGRVAEAEKLVTDCHIRAVQDFCSRHAGTIDLIGFHGQTIFHDPDRGITWQIGDGARLAAETGIDVVYDFRTNDMKNGGQGAPLLPLYHRALIEHAGIDEPACILNIGGVGNITWVAGDRVYACDTGPGNALLDDWMRAQTGTAMDMDGQAALRGTPDIARISAWLSHPYFKAPAPKSLDRNAFQNCSVADLSTQDGAATLAAFTVACVLKALALMPGKTHRLIVAGGGRKNAAMMRGLAERMHVTTSDALGWPGDHLEAEGFAYLAVRSLHGLPLSLPTTTGCAAPSTGGHLIKR